MKKNGKKSTLIASILSVVLSVTMLLGTTLAWFTDTVTNDDNLIGSGILDVELYVDSDGIKAEKGYDIAKTVDQAGTETVIPLFEGENWEPNDTEFAFIRVDNAGTLAFKYDMVLNIEDVEMTGVNADNGLSLTDVLEYVIFDGVKSTDFAYSDWVEVAAAAEIQKLPKGMVTGWTNVSGQGVWGNDVKLVSDGSAVSGMSHVSFLAPTSKSSDTKALRPEIYQVVALGEEEIAAGVIFSGYTKLIANTTAPLNPYVQIYCLRGYEDTTANRINSSPITIQLVGADMAQGEWTKVSQELTLEEGTVALAIHVCSTAAKISSARPLHSTEIHWDNIQILKKPASGTNE